MLLVAPAPFDSGEAGPSRRGGQDLLGDGDSACGCISKDDVDADERGRDDLLAAGCEAIACDVRVLASQECHQCRAPLGDLRPPERDELSRLTIIEPQDSQLVLQESRLLAGLDDETLILGNALEAFPSQNNDG